MSGQMALEFGIAVARFVFLQIMPELSQLSNYQEWLERSIQI
jgi:hypothetical protein